MALKIGVWPSIFCWLTPKYDVANNSDSDPNSEPSSLIRSSFKMSVLVIARLNPLLLSKATVEDLFSPLLLGEPN